jgi:hypothetical protein
MRGSCDTGLALLSARIVRRSEFEFRQAEAICQFAPLRGRKLTDFGRSSEFFVSRRIVSLGKIGATGGNLRVNASRYEEGKHDGNRDRKGVRGPGQCVVTAIATSAGADERFMVNRSTQFHGFNHDRISIRNGFGAR